MALAELYLTKLAEVEKRYQELSKQLSDPNLLSDRKRYARLAREHAELEPVVETYREYRRILKELAENRELLEEADEELRELAREEIKQLEERLETLEKEIPILLLPKDPNDEKSVILEIRAGAGGEEAALFAADLLRMYTRYAERRGWKMEILSANETGLGGFKEVILRIDGQGAYSRLKYESGVHRVQRIPVTESGGRIHTSTVTVAVLPLSLIHI